MTEKYYLLGLTPPQSVTASLQEYQDSLYTLNLDYSSICFSPLIPLAFTAEALPPPKSEFRLSTPLELKQPFLQAGSLYIELSGEESLLLLKKEILKAYSIGEMPHKSDLFACLPALFLSPSLSAFYTSSSSSFPAEQDSLHRNQLIPPFNPAHNVLSFSSLLLCLFEYHIGNNEFTETVHWDIKIRKPHKKHAQ